MYMNSDNTCLFCIYIFDIYKIKNFYLYKKRERKNLLIF